MEKREKKMYGKGKIFLAAMVAVPVLTVNGQPILAAGGGGGDIILTLPEALDGELADVRSRSTNLGRAVTQAMLAQTGADIAIVSGELLCGSVEAGDVSGEELATCLEPGNYVMTVEASGSEILELLDTVLVVGTSTFPQFSGMTVEASQEAMETGDGMEYVQYRVQSAQIGGEPLDEEKTYVVALCDSMYENEEKYEAVTGDRTAVQYDSLETAFVEYMGQPDALEKIGDETLKIGAEGETASGEKGSGKKSGTSDPAGSDPGSVSGNTSSGNSGGAGISEEEAKAIAFEDAGVQAGDVLYIRVKRERDDGIEEYNVEFYVGDQEYDYEIDAATGQIRSGDMEIEKDFRPNTQDGGLITEEEVLSVIRERLPQAEMENVRMKLDRDDGRQVYEGSVFIPGDRTEYEFEVDANTGALLSWEQDD